MHTLHDHAYKGYYFLTDSKGPVVLPQDAALAGETPTHTRHAYDFRVIFEEETYNLINSGKEWYGDIFSVNLENNYPFQIPGRIEGEALKIIATTAGPFRWQFELQRKSQQSVPGKHFHERNRPEQLYFHLCL